MQDTKIAKLVEELRSTVDQLNKVAAQLQDEKVYFSISEKTSNETPFRRSFSIDRVVQSVEY